MNDFSKVFRILEENISNRMIPIIEQSANQSKRVKIQNGVAIGTNVDLDLVKEWIRLDSAVKTLNAFKSKVENTIKETLGDAEELQVNGIQVVTYKHFESDRLDVAALRENHPKIAAKFTITSPGRRFTVKKVVL